MPADRLTHPREGHSEKLCALTDFEFRVWSTYRWAADDFGVMRLSGITIQDWNSKLARDPLEQIDAALRRFIGLGLLLQFEHQGRGFVCSYDWQNRQTVRYPRETFNPPPSPEVLEQCSLETRKLFRSCHPTLRRGNKTFQKVPKNSEPRARAGAGNANANGKELTQTLTAERGSGGKPKAVDRGAAFSDDRLRIPTFLDDDLARMHPTFDRIGFYQRLSIELGDAPMDQRGRPFFDWVTGKFCEAANIPPPDVQARGMFSTRPGKAAGMVAMLTRAAEAVVNRDE